ncbi:MAG: hypothetical protein OER82_06400, partial [Nitrosopumilus sp.]|nr:hypothetical protein [Nitrosopumilus sp.]
FDELTVLYFLNSTSPSAESAMINTKLAIKIPMITLVIVPLVGDYCILGYMHDFGMFFETHE